MHAARLVVVLATFVYGLSLPSAALSQSSAPSAPAKVILDTDIGDDIDDAFALALVLRSPEMELVGVTTAWGDTALRARLVNRFLKDTGARPIPVLVGIFTQAKSNFSQADWARQGEPSSAQPDAVTFLLDCARKSPGEITLIAIGPLTNLGAAIDRDAEGFRKFKRVVLMGGSIHRGYGDLGYTPNRGPQPEYNIYSDVPAAKKLFASGVPVFMMPLDSTQLQLDETKRTLLFSTGSAMTNSLAALYFQWVRANRTPTATLFDAMAVAYAADPNLCPITPLHITVDEKGMTIPGAGTSNVSACLNSDSEQFFRFLIPRLMSGAQTQPAHSKN